MTQNSVLEYNIRAPQLVIQRSKHTLGTCPLLENFISINFVRFHGLSHDIMKMGKNEKKRWETF
jgi:hypothetical protein